MNPRPALALTIVAALVAGGTVTAALGAAPDLGAPSNVVATAQGRDVQVTWAAEAFPSGSTGDQIEVRRDGVAVATVDGTATSWTDPQLAPGRSHSYVLVAHAVRGPRALTSPPSAAATVDLPAYLVGAATTDITPSYGVNIGGFGLGDGSVIPSAVTGRGGYWPGPQPGDPSTPRIRSRAIVVDDGKQAVAIADIETQGMFAAYEAGPYGLHDIAATVAHDIPGLPLDHIVIGSDHTHHGPDTIGAWGGVGTNYLQLVRDRTVQAIETAYANRQFASIRAGQSDASDLVYNQACTEALNQSKTPSYTGPDVCAVPGKDGMVRVVQASAPSGATVATFVVFAAHSTTNIGSQVDGDWPQFLGDRLATIYGGVGMGMEGANGGTQPCRPTCSFTSPSEPGYNVDDRFTAVMLNYTAHVQDALAHSAPVTGPVEADQSFIHEAITGPFVNGLFALGNHLGTPLMRSKETPWMAAQTIRTVAADVRIGSLLFDATPGEGFPAIRQGVADAVSGPAMVIQLGLANDQLGYLIAPASYVPVIAAEAAVNDNILFNVSPTIGDHVMCADITLAHALAGAGWTVTDPPACAPYDAADTAQAAAGDPLSAAPVGGISVP
jgi:hypothetical protein